MATCKERKKEKKKVRCGGKKKKKITETERQEHHYVELLTFIKVSVGKQGATAAVDVGAKSVADDMTNGSAAPSQR